MPRRKPTSPPPDPASRALLQTLHPHAAGSDVGAAEMGVAVPPGAEPPPPPGHPPGLPSNVRRFGTFTADLNAIGRRLRPSGVTTVALESTGVSWIPLDDLLEGAGFEVLLVDPRQAQRAPNRPKTDGCDSQWIQRLHALGLLTAAFRPEESIRVLRSYQRHRANLIEDAGRHIQRVQKALEQMNVKLPGVVSDVTGVTGMGIIKAIWAGERDPRRLARLRDRRCKEDEPTIAKALEGTWRAEHLVELKQSLEAYEYYPEQIRGCDRVIEEHLKALALPEVAPLPAQPRVRRRQDNEPTFDARQRLHQMAAVDLPVIEGIEVSTALTVLSEIGVDLSRWPTEKHFGSWLGLAPNPKKTGGKVKSSRTRPGVNRAAHALRLAARSLQRSKSALGAFFRRIAARRGVAKAITATAYQLARIISAMLKHGMSSVSQGLDAYEAAYQERVVNNLRRKARELGYDLMPKAQGGEAAPQSM